MTTTSASACRSALAASRPPKPAPTITTFTLSFAIGSLRTGAHLNLHHWLPSSQRRFSNPPAAFLRGIVYGYPQSASSARRRDRPRSLGRGEACHRFLQQKRLRKVRDRRRAGWGRLLRRAQGGYHRRHDGKGKGGGRGDIRRSRRAEMGQGALLTSH